MVVKYKDFMIRWSFRATWTMREAALILNELDPDREKFSFNPESMEAAHVLYYWLSKQCRQGFIGPVDETKPERFTPGDIIRMIRDNKQIHSKDVAKLWEVARYGKHHRGIWAEISFTVYDKAITAIQKKYPQITKQQLAKALEELPQIYRFSNNRQLMPYSYETWLRKLRNKTNNNPGRPKKDRIVDIDLLQISEEIRL